MLYINYISIKLGERRSIRIKGCKSRNILPLNSCLPGGAVVKNSPANEGDSRDMDSIPGSGRSPGGGHGNTLQYSCWRIPWTEEPGGLPSTWPQRVWHDWAGTRPHCGLYFFFFFSKFILETLRRNISCFPRHFSEPQIFFCQSVLQFLSRFEPRVEQKHLTVFKKIYVNLIIKLPPSSKKTVVVDKSSWYTFFFCLILCSYKFLSFCIWWRILTNFQNLFFGSWDELI